jgi:uncharacterized protein
MKKIFIFLSLLLISYAGFAQNFPAKPNTLVNDYTQTLSPQETASLENKLVAFNDSTSIQIAVAFIPSLEGYEIADYSVNLFRKWGIGGKEKNTGILMVIAKNDRKVWITTGYGMEGSLPDNIAKRIIENEIKPNFKEGNYYAGINAGTDAIISFTKGEYKADKPKKQNEKSIPAGLLILIIVVIIVFISKGGGGNGGRNVIGGRGGANMLWWSLLAGMAGSGSRSGGNYDGGGFGSGGGGFGGFGGGSSGGGGAGGSW